MPRRVVVVEEWDPEARARALEALRLRLDPAGVWPEARCWPAIARALGYDSGNAAKRAAWRTFNRHQGKHLSRNWQAVREVELLAEAVDLPGPDIHTLRRMLSDLDRLQAPEDRDPPKPKAPPKPKPRKLSKKALREAIRQRILDELHTVDAAPDPRALIPVVFREREEGYRINTRQPRQDTARESKDGENP